MSPPPAITRQAQLTGHNAAIFALAPGHEPGSFLSAAGDGWIAQWQLAHPENGRLIARTERQIFSLLALPDQRLVAGTLDGGLHWIYLNDPTQNRDIAHHAKGVFALLSVADLVYSIGGGGLLTCWDSLHCRSLASIQLSNQSLRSIDYHAGRHELAVGASDNHIYLLDAATLQLKHTLHQAHTNSIFTVRYGPTGEHLYSGGRDAYLRIWHLAPSPTLLSEQPAHLATLNDLIFHPSGHWFATASRDKTVKIWETATGRLRKVLDIIRDGGHRNSVNCLLWLNAGNTLLSAGDDRTIILWDTSVLSS